MTTRNKFSSILASVMVLMLAIPGGAWAGGGRYDNGGYDYGHQKKGQYSSHYSNHYNSHYNNYYKGGNDYRGGRYYYPNYHGYTSCGNTKSHHHNNNNNNDKLWLGLLGGGIVGYTLSNVYSGY
jgi:hypothetical protein